MRSERELRNSAYSHATNNVLEERKKQWLLSCKVGAGASRSVNKNWRPEEIYNSTENIFLVAVIKEKQTLPPYLSFSEPFLRICMRRNDRTRKKEGKKVRQGTYRGRRERHEKVIVRTLPHSVHPNRMHAKQNMTNLQNDNKAMEANQRECNFKPLAEKARTSSAQGLY